MLGALERSLWLGCMVCLVAVLGANDKDYELRRELGGGSRKKKGWMKVENNGEPIDKSQFIGPSDVPRQQRQRQRQPQPRLVYLSDPKS